MFSFICLRCAWVDLSESDCSGNCSRMRIFFTSFTNAPWAALRCPFCISRRHASTNLLTCAGLRCQSSRGKLMCFQELTGIFGSIKGKNTSMFWDFGWGKRSCRRDLTGSRTINSLPRRTRRRSVFWHRSEIRSRVNWQSCFQLAMINLFFHIWLYWHMPHFGSWAFRWWTCSKQPRWAKRQDATKRNNYTL